MYFSVIIPTKFSEDKIGYTLFEIDRFLENSLKSSDQKKDYEIIVVIDGIKDKTLEIVEKIKKIIPYIKIISRKESRGYCYSIKEGMKKSQGEYKLLIDPNANFSSNIIEKVFDSFRSNVDIINCENCLEKPINIIQSFVQNQYPLKILNKKATNIIFPKLNSNNIFFDNEFKIIAKKKGLIMKNFSLHDRNKYKVNLKVLINNVFNMIRLQWNIINGYYD